MAMAAMNLPRADAQGIRRAVPDSLAGLVAEVSGIVADPSVSEDDVVRALGRGLLAAAAATRLPDLAVWVEIALAAGQADAPLPADLLHGPASAFLVPAGGRLRLLPDMAALRRACPAARHGRPRLAVLAGGRLHVRPAPAQDVVVGFDYHRLPAPLAAPGDKPEGLPVHLAGPLLVAYACRELFERLEEGADGIKTQTAAYGKRHEVLLAELTATTGPRQTAPVDVPSAADPYGFGEDCP